MASVSEGRIAVARPRILKSRARASTLPPAQQMQPASPLFPVQPHVSLVFNEKGHASVAREYAYVREIYSSPASPSVVDLYKHTESGHEIVIKRNVKKKMMSHLQVHSASRELDLHRNITHSHIVSCLSSGENEDEYIMALEFVCDYDYFRQRLEDYNKPFSLKHDGGINKLRSFTFDILSALEYLHSHGIIHLDIKPANLLLDRNVQESEYPLVKLCDFGLSRKVDANGFAYIEKKCGTDQYMAPEVRANANVTTAADMWSFGILVHQLTVGFLPQALKWQPGEALPSLPRYWRKYQGTGLLELIDSCLKLAPSERITAAAALQHSWFNRNE